MFDHYYCQDQYRAQYLIGGAAGYSIIVEGDNIIHNDHGFRALTNFYQSNPDLGGYPCWRYDKAVEMLESCNKSEDDVPSVDPTVLMSEVVYGLEANKTYYWKIIATPQNSKGFCTSSLTYSFKTVN